MVNQLICQSTDKRTTHVRKARYRHESCHGLHMPPGITTAASARDVHAIPRVALFGRALVKYVVRPVLMPRVHRIPEAF